MKEISKFWKVSIGLFALGVVASFLGTTAFKVNLFDISSNIVIANMIYITFVIIVIERVLESYNSSLRKPLRLDLESVLKLLEVDIEAKKKQKHVIEKSSPHYITDNIYSDCEAQLLELEREYAIKLKELKQFKNETRITLLMISVSFAGFLSAFGCLNIFAPFIDDTLFISANNLGLNQALFDGLNVVISAWIVAGGSEGWNSVTSWAESNFKTKKS